MKDNIYMKILKYLDEQDISESVSLTPLFVKIYRDRNFQLITVTQKLRSELSKILNFLKDRGYIDINNFGFHEHTTENPEDWFNKKEAKARITLDGIKYLQSEQDAQITREFITAQKEFLVEQAIQIRKQTDIINRTFYISVISLLFIAYTTYDTFKGGVEKQLKELVISQKELRTTLKDSLKYPTMLPLQTLPSKPLKTTYKK
ncbi:MAG: hypothetical protein MUF58_14940 [Arcicella sp.]|jgi:hypothetical protein|nr:hypothetical protein [Arcicella sp.]